MIVDIADLQPGSEIRADAVVVGSGLAGVEVARRLAAQGRSVTLLESGRRDFDPAIQELYRVSFAGRPHRSYEPGVSTFHGYLPEHYRGLNRIRQFGGTSNSWTGKWRRFDAAEFGGPSWIPDSSWPLGLDELLPSYRAVAADYALGDPVQELESPRLEGPRSALAEAGLETSMHYWEERQTRSPERFGSELEGSESIRVVLGATATELVLDDGLERVSQVRCRSLEGHQLSVTAPVVVLALGGLEVPRLLLLSNRQVEGGVGNAHDLVGRYYQDHSKHHTARLQPGPALAELAHWLQSKPRPRFAMAFGLSARVREQHRLLRHAVYLSPRYEIGRQRLRRALSLRPAFRDGNGRVHHYRAKFATEQAPNRDSRVRLGDRLDALGQREGVVDWRFTELDHHSIAAACRELKSGFARAGLGRLDFGVEPVTLEATTDAAHPIGTARMAASPTQGVVDTDCRVHGTRNLYIASSAVFPTSAVYSPTFTILALAHRLGDHLARTGRDEAILASG